MQRLIANAVFATALVFAATAADAQVYKWKDANGTTHYSDAPPATGSNYEKVRISSNTATPIVTTPASATSTTTPKATTQPTTPTTKISDTAANRAKLCKDLDNNITLLGGSQPLTSGDAGTPQQNMSDVQRRQELATARAQKLQYCTGG